MSDSRFAISRPVGVFLFPTVTVSWYDGVDISFSWLSWTVSAYLWRRADEGTE